MTDSELANAVLFVMLYLLPLAVVVALASVAGGGCGNRGND